MSETPSYLGLAVLIEDDATNRNLFDTVLRSVHFDVLSAGNGKEGVCLVEDALSIDRIPGIVFLDMMMPEMGGIECARSIRAAGYKGPILAFSADTASRTRNAALEAGVNQYFLKTTFNRELVAALILKHCGIDVDAPQKKPASDTDCSEPTS